MFPPAQPDTLRRLAALPSARHLVMESTRTV